ncbi:MAG: hypothetical protein AAF684_03720 [Pseudomonadota bacterium]
MIRVLAPAAAALALTLAAGDAAAQIKDRCGFYEDQFDELREQHADPPKFDVARRWRLLGERYCNTGYASAGQRVLRYAIGLLDEEARDPTRLDEQRQQPRQFRIN